MELQHLIKDIIGYSVGVMSQCPVQVQDTEASYKMVSYNFEYCPLCRTIKSVHDRTVLADMYGEQLQDLTEKRLVRCESEQRHILGAAAELCHGQNALTNPQQTVEERESPQPSALIIQSTPTQAQAPDRRAGEDIFSPAIAETGHRYSQMLVTGRL